jgi:glycopeptide antibiotics resistance protein
MSSSGRGTLIGLCAGYALIMLYASTVIGPLGIHYVFRDPADALSALLSVPYADNGSDQRADWMGNLLMLVPYGGILTAALWPRRPALQPLSVATALAIAFATIVVIKYLQLFFPPRTVTLNYILAQSGGALAGSVAYLLLRGQFGVLTARRDKVAALVVALRLYSAALMVFVLLPLDFALDEADLRTQLDRLPETMFALPGAGRPLPIRLVLIAAASAAFIPVGMLLAFVKSGVYRVRSGLASVGFKAVLIAAGLFGLSVLVISGTAMLAPILFRTFGMIAGAAMLMWLIRQDPDSIRSFLRSAAPWLAVPYLAGLAVVNRVASLHWLSWDDAIAQLYPLGLLPLFDYYIVTKGTAAKNIIGHALMYLPAGVLLWMRYGRPAAWPAAILAFAISFVVETARYFRPGLEGDINVLAVASLSALAGARLAPAAWDVLTTLIRHSAARTYRRREQQPEPVFPAGDIEHY